MRRKRRRIQYYGGESPKRKLGERLWLPFVIVAAVALCLALIVGGILGNKAKDSHLFGEGHKDLVDFGGVEASEEKYGTLPTVSGDFLDHRGMDAKALRDALTELPEGSAAALTLYDGAGNVFFDAALLGKSNTSLVGMGTLSAKELVETLEKKERYGVAVFVTGALREQDGQLRILKVSEEVALLREISEAGFREIFIVGFPTDSDDTSSVNGYMRQASEACEGSRLGVAVSSSDALSSGISRLVACTAAYADSYAIDFRDVSVEQLKAGVEKTAYYLTTYRMRLLLGGAERDALVEISEAYGLADYLIENERKPS